MNKETSEKKSDKRKNGKIFQEYQKAKNNTPPSKITTFIEFKDAIEECADELTNLKYSQRQNILRGICTYLIYEQNVLPNSINEILQSKEIKSKSSIYVFLQNHDETLIDFTAFDKFIDNIRKVKEKIKKRNEQQIEDKQEKIFVESKTIQSKQAINENEKEAKEENNETPQEKKETIKTLKIAPKINIFEDEEENGEDAEKKKQSNPARRHRNIPDNIYDSMRRGGENTN